MSTAEWGESPDIIRIYIWSLDSIIPSYKWSPGFCEIRYQLAGEAEVIGETYCYDNDHKHPDFPQLINHVRAENVDQVRQIAYHDFREHIRPYQRFHLSQEYGP